MTGELIFVLIVVATTLLIYSVLRIIFNNRLIILQRINEVSQVQEKKTEDDPYSLPFKERIVMPAFKQLERMMNILAPSSLKNKEHQLLRMAGYPKNLTLQKWISIRIIVWLFFGIFFTFFGLKLESLTYVVMYIGVGWTFGYIGPIFYLKKKATVRRQEIEKGLPDVLDILTVSVNAGLGFDAALVKVVEKTKGTLSEEFNKTLHEIKMGKSRKEALKDLGERNGVDDLTQFTSSIIQAEQLGVRMSSVLKVQSEDMRNKRRQKAEEKAMKAPLKMLFPLIIFIVPAIFIIVLGPAIISIMNNFVS